ncbi:DUF3822 family protein [Xanthovirga aplysinae]|uniref:DUF3822 family protein n=1 Tax=Xanthovirga aplysinae TaxID=2529853 RepID=UPI0012BD5582|nr:DUF3822 family protein [Xanthovirga aplysinae]
MRIEPKHSIKDERFTIDKLHQYSLSIQVSPEYFLCCVTDKSENRCLFLEDYRFDRFQDEKELFVHLLEIFEQHSFLTAGFWNSVRLSVDTPKFALIPSTLFDSSALNDYLKWSCPIDPEQDKLLFYHGLSNDVVGVYAINSLLYDWVKSLYPNLKVQFFHQSIILIEACLKHAVENSKKNFLSIFKEGGILHLVVVGEGRLQFYNQFIVPTKEKALKYILLTMQELDLATNVAEVMLWGNVKEQSPLFILLNNYFDNLSFGERTPSLKLGLVFDELEDQEYHSLFNLSFIAP